MTDMSITVTQIQIKGGRMGGTSKNTVVDMEGGLCTLDVSWYRYYCFYGTLI